MSVDQPDTSDIPEADEEFFKRASLRLPAIAGTNGIQDRPQTAAEARCVKAAIDDGCSIAPRHILRLVRTFAAAMREPDDEMLDAYMNALEQPANPDKEPWHKAKMRKRWRAMMDRAFPP